MACQATEVGRLKRVVDVLRQDNERTKLTLNLGSCKRKDLPVILELSGHPSLEELTIDLNSSIIHNLLGVSHLIEGLSQLVKLHLSFAWSSRLVSATQLATLQSLKVLSLNFSGCAFDVQLPGIEHLESLETLWIEFSYTQTTGILDGLFSLTKLRQLTLLFGGCQNLVNEESLVPIQRLEELESLTLDFSRGALADSVPNTQKMPLLRSLRMDFSATKTLPDSLKRCTYSTLTHLTISFRQCNQLDTIGYSIWRQCSNLDNLTLDVSNSSRLRHCRGLAALELSRLSRCSLNFSFCIRLEDVLMWLRRAVSNRPQIDVDFTGCTKLDPSLQTHFYSLEDLEELELWPSPDTTTALPATGLSTFLFGDKVEYFSDYNQQWLPAVVSLVTPDYIKVEFEADGKSWTSKRIKRAKSLRWPWAGRNPKLSNDLMTKVQTRAEEEILENVAKWSTNELKEILAFRGLPVSKAFNSNQQTLRSWIRGRQSKSDNLRGSCKTRGLPE